MCVRTSNGCRGHLNSCSTIALHECETTWLPLQGTEMTACMQLWHLRHVGEADCHV